MTDKQLHAIQVALNFLSEQVESPPEQREHRRRLACMWLENCPLSKQDIEDALQEIARMRQQ